MAPDLTKIFLLAYTYETMRVTVAKGKEVRLLSDTIMLLSARMD